MKHGGDFRAPVAPTHKKRHAGAGGAKRAAPNYESGYKKKRPRGRSLPRPLAESLGAIRRFQLQEFVTLQGS
jgi:hypothetical protein